MACEEVGKCESVENACSFCFQRCLYCGMYYSKKGEVIRRMECIFCKKLNERLYAIAFAKRCYALVSRCQTEEEELAEVSTPSSPPSPLASPSSLSSDSSADLVYLTAVRGDSPLSSS